ncbi:MAG: cytochrome P460 family protein [Gammaproteobacteria bacterium]|nr:cytochrome P460 family protein [Gammaproteobacteria bacterium]
MNRLHAFLLVAPLSAAFASDPSVPYPEDYRDWRHVKSMVIHQGHPLYESFGGIHHLYANRQAVHGYKTGVFQDGAVIVFDLLEAKSDGNAVVEGNRKIAGVMHKNSRLYRSTGGWGFEGFKGDSKTERAVGHNAATACYQCHTQVKEQDFIFSNTRD